MKKIFYAFAALVCTTSLQALAQIDGTGYDHGNGGDPCEMRFKTVAADIQSWLTKGGAQSLVLPKGVSYTNYLNGMLGKIETAKVSCVDEKLFIEGAEKTCVNFTEANGDFRIQCNISRFTATSESNQYVLVHHEYAGLAGFETNTGEASNYVISSQITDYLENAIVKKLAVKPPPALEKNPFDPAICTDANMTPEEVYKTFSANEKALVPSFTIYTRERWCSNPNGCTEWKSIRNQITHNENAPVPRKYLGIPNDGTINYLSPAYMDPSVTLSSTQDTGVGIYLNCKPGGEQVTCTVSSTPFLENIGEAKGTIGAHCTRLNIQHPGFFADRAFFESELIFKYSYESGLIPNAPWIERESVIISRY
ncbi:MAG: hypothetical protein JSU04_17055 [Bdellovibrionales bacterium]|nr:hypothetical protein [Bdellovibrionales bacterium]